MAVVNEAMGNITEILATNITFTPLFGGQGLNLGTVKLIYEKITSKKNSNPTYTVERNYYGTVDEQLYAFGQRTLTVNNEAGEPVELTGKMLLAALAQIGDVIYNELTGS